VPLFRRGERASTLDLLVVGLGNPGSEYRRTRHNVGFMIVDELAGRHAGKFRSKFSGQLADIRLDDMRLALLEPMTYMNESGRSVASAVHFYKVSLHSLLVAHDEVDLPEGRLQARLGGGLAGHNGLRSVAASVGSQAFLRLRVGVGRPERGDRRPVADFVLSPFPPETDVASIVARGADAIETIALAGLDEAQRLFNEKGSEP